MNDARISVMIADSQKLFARALSMALVQAGGFHVLPETPTRGLDALKVLGDAGRLCDLVILDYWIGTVPGPATTRVITRAAGAPRVIVTGWFHNPPEVNDAFQSGAAAFVSKSIGFDQLLQIARRVASGESNLYGGGGNGGIEVVAASADSGDDAWARFMALTVREIEVLSLLNYAPVEKVAKTLSISLGTLRNHISNILRKTRVRSQIEAIDVARRVGLIDS